MRENKRRLGGGMEQLAARFLIRQGFELLEQNFSCRQGEIDLILRESGYLVFTEVKYRSDPSRGFPQEAVDRKKQNRIIRTAQYYLLRAGLPENTPCRFDVVAILGEDITLLRNAFETNG